MRPYIILSALIAVLAGVFFLQARPLSAMPQGENLMSEKPSKDYPALTLAGGCFWCLESEFRALDGVLYTVVGYTGGDVEEPSYEDVTTGKSGHAEAVQVVYDPDKISEEDLLHYFFEKAHDPTQLNRQGVDIGPQYRSAVFYADEAQKQRVQAVIDAVNESGAWDERIVTTLEPETTFWVAEDYHQQYYEKYEKSNGRKHIRVLLKHKEK